MERKYLNIHLEGMDDNGEKLKRILDENIPCAISIAPETLRKNGIYSKQYPYLLKHIDLIAKIVNQPGNILGQQGNIHKCKHRHRFTDPWHENSCLYKKPLRIEEQREIMQKGCETLVKLAGKRPEMYVPPNHQFDINTLDAACEEEYPFFVMRGLTILDPLLYKISSYNPHNLLVVPETKLGNLGAFKYIHYDEIKNNKPFEKVVRNARSFHNIGIDFDMQTHYMSTKYGLKPDPIKLERDWWIIKRNMEATNKRKILRDARNFLLRLIGIK